MNELKIVQLLKQQNFSQVKWAALHPEENRKQSFIKKLFSSFLSKILPGLNSIKLLIWLRNNGAIQRTGNKTMGKNYFMPFGKISILLLLLAVLLGSYRYSIFLAHSEYSTAYFTNLVIGINQFVTQPQLPQTYTNWFKSSQKWHENNILDKLVLIHYTLSISLFHSLSLIKHTHSHTLSISHTHSFYHPPSPSLPS